MSHAIPFVFPPKSVSSVLDFGLDWAGWLERGDSIVSYTVTCSDNALTISTPTLTHKNGKIITSSFIGGGVVNTSYLIKFKVVTQNGLTDEESAVLNILNY